MKNKGYKAFNKGLICREYQFKENAIFEEEYVKPCISGFHYCKNPIEVLNYYNLFDHNGNLREFAEVEALDEELTDDNIKYCTKKIKIGEKLSLNESIKVCIDYAEVHENSGDNNSTATSDDWSRIVTSGNGSRIATSGYYNEVIMQGENNVSANIGVNGKIKGKIGDWITLAEYDKRLVCICVKSAQIDGVKLKEDVFYKLENGEFVEV